MPSPPPTDARLPLPVLRLCTRDRHAEVAGVDITRCCAKSAGTDLGQGQVSAALALREGSTTVPDFLAETALFDKTDLRADQ